VHAFTYQAATSIAQAVELLAREGEQARVLCGGTDLLIQMRSGARRPRLLIDVKGIPELRALSYDPKAGLCLGAAVSCIEISESALMRRYYPGLSEAAHLIGSLQIQQRASVGGNLCNASPAADTSPALLALDARVRIAGPGGTRELPVAQFFAGPGRNVLGAGEFVTQILIAPPAAHSADSYLRLIPRNEMDIAIVGAGAAVTLEGDRCIAARIALGAVAPTPILAPQAAAALVGPLDERAIERAVALVRAAAQPISDMRGTADYRRQVVGVLARRAILNAAARARDN